VAPNLSKAKAALTERRDEVQRLSDNSAEARDTVMLDQTSVGRLSRMDSLQQQAMAEATERHRALELAHIEAALKRIEDDEYGYCQNCGEEIAEKRLAIDPAATHCIKCAK